MATAMQIIRHRTFSYNMVSRRYTSEKIEFYTPNELRKQAKNNRQASDGLIEDQEAALELFVQHYLACLEAYEKALTMGFAVSRLGFCCRLA